MTRSVLSVTAVLLMVACNDATGPNDTEPLSSPSPVMASAAGSFSAEAVLSGNLVTTANPVTYAVDFRRRFSSISRVSYFFVFGDDRLDPNDCLHIFPSDASSGGAGVCSRTTSQTSRQLDFPCTTHSEECDHWRDGVSRGEFRAQHLTTGDGVPVSVGLRSVTITIDGETVLTVRIDIKPGSSRNSINPRSNGLIQVAILTTARLNAARVDPSSVRFGPSGATRAHRRSHFRDVDGDGDRDLVLDFRTRATGIECGDRSAGLTGRTTSGKIFEGSDAIRTVDCRRR